MQLVDLLDELEALLEEGRPVPLTGSVVISRRQCLDLIDRIRTSLPEEIREADRIQRSQRTLLQESKAEAEAIEREARERAAFIVAESELVKTAELKAEALVRESREKARQMVHGAQQQAETVYARLEDQLVQLLKMVRESSTRRR